MKINTKLIFSFFFAFSLFFSFGAINQIQAVAQEVNPVNAYLFHGDGCPHCAQEQDFMHNDLKLRYPNLEIKEYEIYKNRQNGVFLQKIGKELDINVPGVPFLVIGDKSFVGYMDGLTSKEIESQVELCTLSVCPDSVAAIASSYPADKKNTDSVTPGVSSETGTSASPEGGENEKLIKLPFLGEVDAMSFSLPVLTIIIGALDGFNPCAMWVLIFLISLTLGMKSRKRMWALGLTFIVTSASVYFIFMSAWLNLIMFLGFIVWVRIAIALVALLGGAYSLKDFFTNKNAACKVGNVEKKQKTLSKLKKAALQNSIWLALGGIIVLAFAVNLVELICSAGLPAVYTQVLALSELPAWKNYLYILLYVFFFMLDDLIIFFIAMTTLKVTGITTKYSRYSRLIGGIIMVIIGILLLFRPEWLMFG